jgi:coenzyme PQQ synthesis protein D (PqqD)
VSPLRLRREGVTWLEVDGEVVALDAESSKYLSANASGAVLWQALAKGATRDELAEALTSTFGIDEATARGDVDAFVAELEARQLLEDA